MAEPSPDLSAEVLLREAAWLRGLAATLVVDGARADDLVQQTLLAAIERPPARVANPRAWLGKVATNLARRIGSADLRRDARERASAPDEALPPTDEIVAHTAELHRVVGAVLALAEPYRTVVLLRFYEELKPAAIARRVGAPVETVRTRIRRGLELLRAELVRRRGDSERDASAWAVALLGLLDGGLRRVVRRALLAKATAATSAGGGVAGATALAGAMGVLGMSTSLKLAAAVLVVAGGTFAVVKFSGSPQTPPHESVAGAASAASGRVASADLPAATPPPAEVTRAPEVRAAVKEKPAAEAAAVASAAVEGIVLTPDGEPAAGATVLLESAAPHGALGTLEDLCANLDVLLFEGLGGPLEAKQRTVAAEDGTFRFKDLAPGSTVNLAAVEAKEGTAVEPGVVLARDGKTAEIELHLVEGVVLHGTVTDEQGTPVRNARVTLDRVVKVGSLTNTRSLATLITDENGGYRTIALPFRNFFVNASAKSFLRKPVEAVDLLDGEKERVVDVRLTRAATLSGRIVGPDGKPAGLARVRGELWIAWSDSDPGKGEERIDFLTVQSGALDLASDRYEVTPEGKSARFISAWAGDQLLGVGKIVAPGAGPDVVVDLSKVREPTPKGALAIEVVNAADGTPVARFDADYWPDPTGANDARFEFDMHRAAGAAGRLEVPNLRAGPYDVAIRADGFAPRFLAVPVTAPATTTRVELHAATGFVAGHVLDENGRPVAGADLYLLGSDGRAAAPWPDCHSNSDRDGAFEFKKVAEGGYTVVAEHDDVAPACGAAIARTSGASANTDVVLTLRKGVSVEFRPRSKGVELSGPFVYRIRDERGVPVVDHQRRPGSISGIIGKGASIFRLAPAPYTVELFCPQFAPAKAAFTATDGKVIEIELTPAR